MSSYYLSPVIPMPEEEISPPISAPPATSVTTMVLTRCKEVVRDKEGIPGRRGIITIAGHTFHTVERCLRGWSYLRPGSYRCKHLRRPSGKPAIWPERYGPDGKPGQILIHVANYPSDLTGCIAPGLKTIPGGVGDSRLALTKIFELLGGFNEGKLLHLDVVGDMDNELFV